jgi:uridine kinase
MSENEKINDNLNKKFRDRPYLIGITGGSGGGKTSVANVLYRCLGIENCLLFSMDTYYKNLTPEQEKDLNNYNFDTPDALDLDLLSEHLTSLMNWKSIEMPTYDFATNKRQEETIHLKPNKFIIFEGILAFHDKRMRDLMDLKLFIDLDDDIRLSRRIYRDIISRGRKMKDVIERYHKFVKPAYNTFIKPTKAYADIIIPRGGSNTIAIDLINYYLKYKLSNIFPENIQSFIIDKLNNSEEKKIDEEKKENVKEEEDYVIKKVVLKELLKKDNIELVKNEDIFDEKICLIEPSEKNLYFNIFINYLLGKKVQYFDLYLDIFTKKIGCIVKKDIIIFINNEFKNVESIINKRIKLNKNEIFKVYIYAPILLEFSEKLKQFINYLKDKKEVNTISIISIFLKKDLIEQYDKDKIEFKSIYCGSAVDNYHDFIENGGYYSKMEGEYSNNLVSFSENNFEGKLAQSIEMNKII